MEQAKPDKCAEFDRFAEEYRFLHEKNIRTSGEAPGFFAEYKIKDIAKVISRSRLSTTPPTILDFGSGIGTSLPYLRKYFPKASLTCLDVSRKSLTIAESRFPGLSAFIHFDGETIPFESNTFDVILAACVFHHIDHSVHNSLLKEIRRILKPGGSLFIFEHNPLNPLTLHAVNSCEFDVNAHLIYGKQMHQRFTKAEFKNVHLRYRIFFPRILAWLRWLEPYLMWLPLGAQYYVLGSKSSRL